MTPRTRPAVVGLALPFVVGLVCLGVGLALGPSSIGLACNGVGCGPWLALPNAAVTIALLVLAVVFLSLSTVRLVRWRRN